LANFLIKTILMKKLLLASAVAATLTLSGCATIFGGSTQAIIIASEPDAASVTITNSAGEKVHSGNTPLTVTLKRGAGYFRSESYKVSIEKAGFKPSEVTITGSMNGWYFGNLLVGGLIGMLAVDPVTGAMWKLSPETVKANLTAMEGVKTSMKDGSLPIVPVSSLPAAVMAQAQLISK
jgi:hypothetical protein